MIPTHHYSNTTEANCRLARTSVIAIAKLSHQQKLACFLLLQIHDRIDKLKRIVFSISQSNKPMPNIFRMRSFHDEMNRQEVTLSSMKSVENQKQLDGYFMQKEFQIFRSNFTKNSFRSQKGRPDKSLQLSISGRYSSFLFFSPRKPKYSLEYSIA